ncbi:MAG: S-layer protein [Flavipsychrobacter sp.]|nr:S-layer protein [Flavipsychrobacter sp.]
MKNILIVLTTLLLLSFQNNAQTITLIAGIGGRGSSGDGGPATAAQVSNPQKIAIDKSGNIYFGQSDYIRKISPSGTITTIAGTGKSGYSGDGGAATAADIFGPAGIVIDRAGNIYFVDNYNNVIRKINTSGIISTVAGSGVNAGTGMSVPEYYVHLGDGGPATAADLGLPIGIAIDGSDNLYIGDFANNRIRKITPAGIITTIAGNGIQGTAGDGGPATAAEVNNPYYIALDTRGNIYFTSLGIGINTIRKIDASGYITTIAGNGTTGYRGDGGAATAAVFNGALDVTVSKTGDIYITDFANYRIRMINSLGIINTIAGNGIYGEDGYNGPATAAKIGQPKCVTLDDIGNLYFSADNRIKRVSADPVSVSKIDITSDRIEIYPNPTNGLINILCNQKTNHISITNSLGQLIYSKDHSEKLTQINMSHFSAGIYFVSVNDRNKYKVVKE